MNLQDLSYIAAIITAMVGTYLAESVHRKNITEATNSLVTSAMDMVDSKDKEIDALEKDQTVLRLYAGYLSTGCELLRQQLLKACIEPTFNPVPLSEYKNK